METKLKIFVDRLKKTDEKIKEKISFQDLNLEDEKDLKFVKPILIDGKAYISNEDLIINLNIKFYISMPCSVCNEFVEKELLIKNLYITQKLTDISSSYEYKSEIRNACFLEIPSFVECMGNCQERQNIKNYFKKETDKNFPFSNLEE